MRAHHFAYIPKNLQPKHTMMWTEQFKYIRKINKLYEIFLQDQDVWEIFDVLDVGNNATIFSNFLWYKSFFFFHIENTPTHTWVLFLLLARRHWYLSPVSYKYGNSFSFYNFPLFCSHPCYFLHITQICYFSFWRHRILTIYST